MAERRRNPELWQADLIAVVRDASALLALPPERLDVTLRMLRRTQLLGRVAHRLQLAGMLDSAVTVVRDQLASALVVAESRVRAARWELDRIAVALDGLDDVPVIALKGCAYLLAGTPNVGGRIFSDVDLMVPEARLGEVEARLEAHGWRMTAVNDYDDRYYREWAHELPPMSHPERGIELDLHHNIVMRTARLRPTAERLFEAAREMAGSRFKVLAPVDMVLHAMVHLFHGGEISGGFRDLVDIESLLRHFGAAEPSFWDEFWVRAGQLDLVRPAFYGLHYVGRELGALVPPAVVSQSQRARPATPTLATMDLLVARALFPAHPDLAPRRAAAVFRLALLARAHWVRMPPDMLAKHLAYKLLNRRQRSEAGLERGGSG